MDNELPMSETTSPEYLCIVCGQTESPTIDDICSDCHMRMWWDSLEGVDEAEAPADKIRHLSSIGD